MRRTPGCGKISEAVSAEGQGPREGPGRRLTSEVAPLGEGYAQVAVLPAEAVGEEGREGGCMLPQELPRALGQLLQRQWDMWASVRRLRDEARGAHLGTHSPPLNRPPSSPTSVQHF